ncbi:hypothetical protein lerEdw1_017256 [Lerista edwardsae]|nr:hypothetical protein lerEdw1_017256 [Lerista edwardsae]
MLTVRIIRMRNLHREDYSMGKNEEPIIRDFLPVVAPALASEQFDDKMFPILDIFIQASSAGLSLLIIKMANYLVFFPTVSESDCYVTLWLPTSSPEKVRTKTIANCKDPVWNEAFYFRIQSQVKNVLELTIFDEDIIRDDESRVIFFDIAKVPLGGSICVTFELNPECREAACLEVQVDQRRKKKKRRSKIKLMYVLGSFSLEQEVRYTLKGSYEETQLISLNCASNLHFTDGTLFHYCKHMQAELEVLLLKKRSLPSFDKDLNLHLKAKDWTSDLDLRLGFDLCAEEQAFLQKRKKVAAAALKRCSFLWHVAQVPVVAIMTTGGGIRALTALYAHLLSIQKLDILDCISYFTGLSGTTWTMSHLYNDPNWSHNDLEEQLVHIQKHVKKNKFLASFALERLKYYAKELWQRTQEGHRISFTDLWGLIIEAMLHDGENPNKLSDQQQALTNGQNPLPVYLCLSVKEKLSNRGFREWLEFTPYEVGFQKYGAYIRTEHFGSEFFMGHLMKKIPESRICYLEGNLITKVFIIMHPDMPQHFSSVVSILSGHYIMLLEYECDEGTWKNQLRTRVQYPPHSLANVFQNVIMWRPAVSVVPNFLKGCPMHNDYIRSGFSKWKDCDLDTFPNQLTGIEDYLYLVDNAFAFASSYPPLMRPERKVDVIIHLNYSSGSQMMPLVEASEYFSEQGIPFPKIIPSEEEKEVKECYLVGDQESPETPLVVVFPQVCDTFREYKAPGVKRSPDEMEDGDLDLGGFGPYNINDLRYTEKQFDKLVKLSQYNIDNNKDMILKALRIATDRRRQHKKSKEFRDPR